MLLHDGEAVGIKEATRRVGVSTDTIRRWIRRYGIGRQSMPGAPWFVSMIGLEMVRHGDTEALAALHAGDRTHPLVRKYADHIGLTI